MLREAGIPFEVVPGHHRGVAAPAYAGIPVTHRELRQRRGVRHRPRGPGQAGVGARLARAGRASRARSSSTWACARCRGSPSGCIAGGRPADEPVAVDRARHAARPAHARWRRSPTSPSAPRTAGIRAPAITLVGPVAALREQLAWLEARPLHGAHGRRHARPRAGERARRAAARARRRRSSRRRRSAPQPLRRRAARRSPATTSSCVTSPNGARRAVRAPARRARDARRR